MATPLRPSPLSFDTARQSPFKRQNSASPATVRATTPTQTSPVKTTGNGGINTFSPAKQGSLSPEKTSPFVRRPSQIGPTAERPSSPFARPTSGLSVPASPSRQSSYTSKNEDTPPASARATPALEEDEAEIRNLTARPSPFDGPAPDSPSAPLPSQSLLRPTTQRSTPTSTTSTIKPPTFNPKPSPAKPALASTNTAYKNVPQPLLRSMRESFEVLDTTNTGAITPASVAHMLEQTGLSTHYHPRDFFPPNTPAQLNLARYLDTLSAPLAALSPPEELVAAFAAFDVDDSGQIDVVELRKALLGTAPEVGEEDWRMGEAGTDEILAGFCGRRAFGAKGVNVAKGKGEVFRYREFMGAVAGGVGGEGAEGVVV